jgi:uncharacterized protein YbjT (DUF2867 family)
VTGVPTAGVADDTDQPVGGDDTDQPRVLIAGATGGTGRELVEVLAPRAVTVRCLTRSAGSREALVERGADEVVVGDLFEAADADRATRDVDHVLSAVGSSPLAVVGSDEPVDGLGTRRLLSAAVDNGAETFVMESALGVGDGPASLVGSAFNLFIRPIQRAKAEAEAAIRDAPIRHTILRPGVLTSGSPSDDVQVAPPGERLWGAVSRADVARLMAAAPWTPAAAEATFEVVRNPLLENRSVAVEWQLPDG